MKAPLTETVVRDWKSARTYFRKEGWLATVRWACALDAPVSLQFLKYTVFGGATTLVHLSLFIWFSHSLFPAHDYLVEGTIPDQIKEQRAIASNLLAFPVAALVNYLLSVRFVFISGRHSRSREIFLFLVISFLSFAAGLLSGPVLISRGLDPWIAQGGLVASSAIVNFFLRKFMIFLK